MKLEDLNDYSEYPTNDIVERFCNVALDDSEKLMPEETLENLRYLGDKQWHTYKLPSKELQNRIENWLIQNWVSNSEKYLENLLVVCFCFALNKTMYKKALDFYDGKHKREFERNLEESDGGYIDPWWSMKKLKKDL